MKKALYVVLGLVGTLVLILLLAPLFISVDQFRPKVVEIAESKLRAKVEIGKLKLRLFPNFEITSDSLRVVPLSASGFGQPVVQSQSLSVKSSLLGLLSSPSLDVHVNEPTLHMVSKNKKTNVEAILPESTPEVAAAETPAAAPGEALKGLPPFVQKRVEAASFSLYLNQAHLIQEDLDAKTKAELTKVDFSLVDIGLNQNMKARFAADLSFKGDGLTALGPIKAEVDIVSSTGPQKELLLEMKGSKDLSGVELRMTDLFVKKAGIPFGASFAGKVLVAKTIDVDFSNLSMNFGTMSIAGHLKGTDVAGGDKAQVELALKSNALKLADLKSYVPMVAAYKLSGTADFFADIKGSPVNPSLNILLSANGVQGSSPELATPINNLEADVKISGTVNEPLVDVKKIVMKIGKNSDLAARGTVRGIASPVVDFTVESKNIDLDEIMGTPAQGAPAAKAAAPTKEEMAAAKLPLDETLAQMAPTVDESLKNPMLDKLVAKFQTKLSRVKFMGAEYLDANLLVNLRNRAMTVSKTSIRAYRGVLSLSGSMKLVPVDTEFSFASSLSNINVGDAVKAHAPEWVGALSGTALGQMDISGRGFSKKQLQDNLRGSLVGEVKEGKTNLAVIKIVNQVLAAIPKNLSSALSSKAQESTKGQVIEGEFETMKLNASIVGRKVNLKNIDTVFKSSDDRIGRFRFNADGFVTFDQDVNMTGVAYLSPEIVRIAQLKGKSGQIEIPLKFGGKMYEPKPDIGYSVKLISETAGKNLVNEHGKKAVEKMIPELEKKAPPALKNKIKDLKKLFR